MCQPTSTPCMQACTLCLTSPPPFSPLSARTKWVAPNRSRLPNRRPTSQVLSAKGTTIAHLNTQCQHNIHWFRAFDEYLSIWYTLRVYIFAGINYCGIYFCDLKENRKLLLRYVRNCNIFKTCLSAKKALY